MFLDFYKLRDQPFGVTPDPRYLYFSPGHREALASMFYGIETGRGFLSLIAEPGMGKTTDRKSTRLNSSHGYISYAVFCLKKKQRANHYRILVFHSRAGDA